MPGFEVEPSPRPARGDAQLLTACFLLAGTGLAALYSASYGYAEALGMAPEHFLVRQAFFCAAGAVVFFVAALVPLARLRSATMVLTLGCLILLVLPFIPGLGVQRNGASRWFAIGGQTFQPSDAWKLASVLYLAHILAKKADRIHDVVNAALPPLLLVLAGAGIVYAQNDFSTAVLALVLALAMFWGAGVPKRFFLALGSLVLPLAALMVLTSDYRLKRIIAFMFPNHAPESSGYQVLASTRAIASGGFLGKGIGMGTLKASSVPEIQSDFIMAAIAEEGGFLGVVALVLLWAWFAWRAFRLAFLAEELYESLLALGLALGLSIQALVNIAVASGAIPATGIPLPFYSAGGSSLLASAAAAGLLYNLSRGLARPEARAARASAFGSDAEAVHG